MFALPSEIWDSLPDTVKEASARISKYKRSNLEMNEFERKVYLNGQVGQAEQLKLKSDVKKADKAKK